jgi:predicted secreted Zn-dependent protease
VGSKSARACLVAMIAVTSALLAGSVNGEIVWSVDRPLSWHDFRGPVARGAAPREVAVTAATLGWSFRYVLEIADGDCSYRITTLDTIARFDPEQSWVRPGHATASVLAHEQGHFDIAEIHRRKLDAATARYVGSVGACGGRGMKRAERLVEADIERLIGPHYERIAHEHGEMQRRYDRETGHGMVGPAQADWLARIAGELK